MAIKVYIRPKLTYESGRKLRSVECFSALDYFFVDTEKHPTKVVNVFGIGDLYIQENTPDFSFNDFIPINANKNYNTYKCLLGRIIDNPDHINSHTHKTLLKNNGSLIIRAIDAQSQELLITDLTMQEYSWVWGSNLDLESILKSNYNLLKLW